jgi:hypothetical protein
MRVGAWRRRAAAVSLALAPVLMLGAQGAAMTDARVFAAIDRLIAERGKPVGDIEALVQTRLTLDAARSTPFFKVYEGTLPPGRPFGAIEVRASANPLIDKGMFLLRRTGGACIDAGAVMARYGADPAIEPPRAGAPLDAPVYYNYRRDWGALRFGFNPDRPGCLVSVVIDWTG